MAVLKIISNVDCKLYLDQDFVCDLQGGVLHKEKIIPGAYLLEFRSAFEKKECDLIVHDEGQQILKRVLFDFASLKGKIIASDLQYGNDSVREKVRNLCRCDEVLSLDADRFVVRSMSEILVIDSQNFQITKAYKLAGEIKGEDPIPVMDNVNGVCGYIDKRGNELFPFVYEEVSSFLECGYAEVQRFGIKRFINKEGQICVLNTVDEIEHGDKHFHLLDNNYEWCGKLETSDPDSLFLRCCYRLPVLKNGKWGYCYLQEEYWNGPNKIREFFPCEYDELCGNSKYAFVVMRKGKYLCVVNMNDAKYEVGANRGKPIWGEIGDVLFQCEAEELYPILSWKNETVIIDPTLTGSFVAYNFIGKYVVRRNGKYGIIDTNENVICDCIYDDIYMQHWGRNREHEFTSNFCILKKHGMSEIMDVENNRVTDLRADAISKCHNLWIVRMSGQEKCQVYDFTANKLGDTSFDDISYGNYNVRADCGGFSYSGSDDYMIRNGGNYGVLDKNGISIIEEKFSQIERIIECGYVRYKVLYKGKYGIKDKNGDCIVPVDFDRIDDFYVRSCTYGFIVHKGHKVGYYSDSERYIQCIYDDIAGIDCCFAYLAVKLDNKYALCDEDCKFMTDFCYDEIADGLYGYFQNENEQMVDYHLFKTRQGNRYGVVDGKGIVRLDCVYDSIKFSSRNEEWCELEVTSNGEQGILYIRTVGKAESFKET